MVNIYRGAKRLGKKYDSLLAQSHNAIRFWGSLHKNNISCLLLGLYHASVNWKLDILCLNANNPPKIVLCAAQVMNSTDFQVNR